MEGYPAIGFIAWSCLFWALGFACGFLADEWKWRRRRRIEQTDAGKAAERNHRREAAAPLLAKLAELAGNLEAHSTYETKPGPTLTMASIELRQALAALRPFIEPADANRMGDILTQCQDDDTCHHDAQRALDAVRELQKTVVHVIDS